jgi:hypothetical protein
MRVSTDILNAKMDDFDFCDCETEAENPFNFEIDDLEIVEASRDIVNILKFCKKFGCYSRATSYPGNERGISSIQNLRIKDFHPGSARKPSVWVVYGTDHLTKAHVIISATPNELYGFNLMERKNNKTVVIKDKIRVYWADSRQEVCHIAELSELSTLC